MAELGDPTGIIGMQTRNLQNLLEKLGTAVFKPIEDVVDKIGNEKVIKSTKGLNKMLKSMQGNLQTAVLEKFMGLLEPFLNLIDLFTPIFEIIGSILQKALMPVMEALLPIIMMIADFLKENEDLIMELIQTALMPLMELLGLLMEVLPLIMPYLKMLLQGLSFLAKLLNTVVGWLFGHSPGLIPGFEAIAKLLNELIDIIFGSFLESIEMIIDFIIEIAEIIGDTLIKIIEVLADILETVADVIKSLIQGAIRILIAILKSVEEVINKLVEGAITILISILEFLEKVMEGVAEALKKVGEIVETVVGFFVKLGEIMRDVVLGTMDRFNTALKELNKFLENLIELIREIKSIGSIGGGGGGGGGGDCCFPAGTLITLENGITKTIEDVRIGDSVLCYDFFIRDYMVSEVRGIESPIRDHLYTLTFENGKVLELTSEHPIYTSEGWKSIDPHATLKENDILYTQQLKKGDLVFYNKKYIKLTSITFKRKQVQTYNLSSVLEYHNFIANGFLVHNKEGDWWDPIGIFQEGGIVTKKRLGIVGEGGPEGIIPLKRMSEFTGNIELMREIGKTNDKLDILNSYMRQVLRK